MKRFVAALALLAGCASAQAADLPLKAKPFDTPVVASTSPFWIGIEGGLGLSPTENDFTILGASSGPIKGFPTGLLAGIAAGYTFNSGALQLEANVSADYDFSRGCVDIACMAARKNGFLLQEGFGVGFSMTTLGGYLPGQANPSNWLVPITVPASVWANWIIMPEGGYAERNLDLCAVNGLVDPNGNVLTSCGSKFIAAPYAGIKNKFMISAQSELALRYSHVFWGNQYSFTPQAAVPLFANSVTIKGEDIFKAMFVYHM